MNITVGVIVLFSLIWIGLYGLFAGFTRFIADPITDRLDKIIKLLEKGGDK